MNVIQDVIELEVFNENGEFVTKIDTVKESGLIWMEGVENSYLAIKDAIVNFKLIEQLGEVEKSETSDFDKRVNGNKNSKTVVFSQFPKNKKFSLVGRGIAYSLETAELSHDFEIVIPNAELVNEYSFKSELGEPHMPHFVFKINPYNGNDDLFKVVIHERDKK